MVKAVVSPPRAATSTSGSGVGSEVDVRAPQAAISATTNINKVAARAISPGRRRRVNRRHLAARLMIDQLAV